ncbi:MAG: DNA damage-inducible protein D [Candidatus Pacebacteria bacterium]|jgi:DNA-damage-inducible protein D|nr:DNA damage-inducible protein D [Candidatus Paceibacterota bacterium]
MSEEITINSPHKDFESIKHIDAEGVEYWTARELMLVLGYSTWRRFEDTIKRAQQACLNSRQFPQDHFADTGKLTKVGHGIARQLDDYKLDRYACYLIAQNGDSNKKEIAMAQTYFAIQTRLQELSTDEKRLQDREEVTRQNKKLFSTAKLSGVSNFGKFNDAGYKGLYNMSLKEVEDKKKIPKGELLDHAGSEELGANLFRITQTEAKLKRDQIKGDNEAQKTHFDIGKKVRQTIKEIGGTMPENLKPELHIKKLKKVNKKLR